MYGFILLGFLIYFLVLPEFGFGFVLRAVRRLTVPFSRPTGAPPPLFDDDDDEVDAAAAAAVVAAAAAA